MRYPVATRDRRNLLVNLGQIDGRNRTIRLAGSHRASIPDLASSWGLKAVRIGSQYFVEHDDLVRLRDAIGKALAKHDPEFLRPGVETAQRELADVGQPAREPRR
jgi:hypothetical protein